MRNILDSIKRIPIRHNVSTDEIWRDIVGYENLYQISNFGNIRRVEHSIQYTRCGQVRHRILSEKLMKPSLTDSGYLSVALSKDGISKYHLVHRLVALAFIPADETRPQVNHEDGNKQNNHVDNLEWMNASEQQLHAWKIGLIPESRRAEIGKQAKARNTGVKFTDEHKRKISEGLKRYERTEEHNRHISESLSGRQVSEKEKQRLQTLFQGRHHSKETKDYLREINTGRKWDPLQRKYIKSEE